MHSPQIQPVSIGSYAFFVWQSLLQGWLGSSSRVAQSLATIGSKLEALRQTRGPHERQLRNSIQVTTDGQATLGQ